jgi:hypothetical protein
MGRLLVAATSLCLVSCTSLPQVCQPKTDLLLAPDAAWKVEERPDGAVVQIVCAPANHPPLTQLPKK